MQRVILLVALLIAPWAALAQNVIYATSGNGNLSKLYTVDPLTAQSTLVGDVLIGTTPVTVTGLAIQPGTGTLFGLTGSEYSPSRVLLTINPATAQAVIVGTLGTTRFENASDISFSTAGTLFGWTVRGGPLVTIDPATVARTVIGTAMNGTGGNGLAFTPDGTLYLAGPTAPGNLYTVNPSTGALTTVAALSGVPAELRQHQRHGQRPGRHAVRDQHGKQPRAGLHQPGDRGDDQHRHARVRGGRAGLQFHARARAIDRRAPGPRGAPAARPAAQGSLIAPLPDRGAG